MPTPNTQQTNDLELDLELDLSDPSSTVVEAKPAPVSSSVSPTFTQVDPIQSNKVSNPFAKPSAAAQEKAAAEAKAKEELTKKVTFQKVVPSKTALVLSVLGILLALVGIGVGLFLMLGK